MFGKMMNRYYYGKSGKGDYTKEDLPQTRWQLFWEMLRVRLSGLIRLNLMYAVAWLPAIFVIGRGLLLWYAGLANVADAQMQLEAGEITAEALAEMTQSYTQGMSTIIMQTLLLLVPCIAITGPCTAGVCYVTRNWARDEHAFIWSDFKDAVKENWKQGLAISVITGLLPLVVYVCWNFYSAMAAENPVMVVPQVLIAMVGFIWALAVTYFYPLMVSYKLKMRELLRNGLLLAVARLPFSFAVRLLHVVPTVIALICAFFFSPVWSVLGLFLYYLVFGFGLSRFVTASYTNAVFDRFINSRIEGAVINRGLSQETDDDDDDEEEENPQA